MKCDVLIMGAGPAGLQAAIHAARRKVKAVVLGKQFRSSLYKAWVENFCCLESTTTGAELLEHGRVQAERAGARFLEEDAMSIQRTGGFFKVVTEGGTEVVSRAIVVATGVYRNRLGVSGEKEFLGRGVSYCVDCDAPFFKGKDVAIVGCGSAAAAGALLLTSYAREVFLICDRLEVDERLRKQVEAANVHLIAGSVSEIKGDSSVRKIVLRDGTQTPVDGVFIELGAKSPMELVTNLGVRLDDKGFILTDKDQRTNVEGVFAAGDICGPPFQVAKAVGEGCVAGINAAEYVKSLSSVGTP